MSVRHAGTRACVVFLLAFNVFHSVSNCSVCMCCICCVCVCDSVCDVCGAGLGGGGGDGGGGARLELFPPSMQPESFWKGKRSVYK